MKFAKFSIVLIFFMSLAALGMTLFLSTVRENEKQKRIHLEMVKVELEGKIAQIDSEKQTLEQEVKSMDVKLQEALSSLKVNQSEVDALHQELDAKKQELDSKNQELTNLESMVRNFKSQNNELEEKMSQLEIELQKIRGNFPLGANTVATGFSGTANPAASPSFTLGGTPDGSLASQTLQAGRVLLINRKYNFVIINIGAKQGLKSGDAFGVIESGKQIAKVQVEKLYDDYAAAKITEEATDKSLLKEGSVLTRL